MAQQPFRPHVIAQPMADVEPEAVDWLWQDRIPVGKLTLLVGDPGVGKSFLTLDMAGRLSRGTPWPDRRDEDVDPAGSVILSAEDDLADTIRVRLDAAGADCSRITAIVGVKRCSGGGRSYFSLDADLRALEDHVAETQPKLVIIDPVTAYVGQKRDDSSNTDIRAVLAPLADLAAKHWFAVLAVTHMNKSKAGQALYRPMGSLAFTAACRTVWLLARDPDDERRRLLLPLKNNLVPEPDGLAFTIEDGRLLWQVEPIDVEPDEVLSAQGVRGNRQQAEDWLLQLLARGPMPAKDVGEAARKDGLTWPTIKRAKASLKVITTRHGFGREGGWIWRLPSETPF